MGAVVYNPREIQNSYLGPFIVNTRERADGIKYSHCNAPSYVPNAFLHLHEDNKRYARNDGSNPFKKPVEMVMYKRVVNLELIVQIKNDIQNHKELGLQLFLIQLIFSNQTGLNFKFCDKALDQQGNPSCKYTISKNHYDDERYACAHSSLLPCLRLEQGEENESSVVLGYKTDFYDTWNATTFLPECVNTQDTKLDRTTKIEGKSLRKYATDLLNDCSSGKITPKQGFIAYLQRTIQTINEMTSKNASESTIQGYYLQVVSSYNAKINNRLTFFKHLCFNYKERQGDAAIVANLQEEMHRLFVAQMREMQPANPPVIIQEPLIPIVDLRNKIKSLNTSFNKRILLTKTKKDYIKICYTDEEIKSILKKYLYETPNNILLENDIKGILKVKTHKTIDKNIYTPDLTIPSDRIKDVYLDVFEEIKKQYDRDSVRSLGEIIFKAMHKILTAEEAAEAEAENAENR